MGSWQRTGEASEQRELAPRPALPTTTRPRPGRRPGPGVGEVTCLTEVGTFPLLPAGGHGPVLAPWLVCVWGALACPQWGMWGLFAGVSGELALVLRLALCPLSSLPGHLLSSSSCDTSWDRCFPFSVTNDSSLLYVSSLTVLLLFKRK